MKEIEFRYECNKGEISAKKLSEYEQIANNARNTLLSKTGKGSNYTGWVDYPLEIKEKEIDTIKQVAKEIKDQSECLVVIGIGGSYLGAKAVIELLNNYYNNNFKTIFLGNNLSPEYLKETIEYLKQIDFSVNVVSKSGKTLEPALAFRFVKKLLIDKYGLDYNKRIYVTTSKDNSILNNEAMKNDYKAFYIPDDIGGRYSIFTAVGLLPICCAGFDIYSFIKGAIISCQECKDTPFVDNSCMQYATIRNILYKENKVMEALVTYEPKMKFFGEWWKQLFGESEGKEHKGIFPNTFVYSTDLHSLGQYVQDGIRNLFETTIEVKNDNVNLLIPNDDSNEDGLNYLTGKSMEFVRKQAIVGVISAHVDGDVPNMIISLKDINEYTVGYLMYFFMFACGISGYILDVNPFNQEGVEAYKSNIKTLLRK